VLTAVSPAGYTSVDDNSLEDAMTNGHRALVLGASVGLISSVLARAGYLNALTPPLIFFLALGLLLAAIALPAKTTRVL